MLFKHQNHSRITFFFKILFWLETGYYLIMYGASQFDVTHRKHIYNVSVDGIDTIRVLLAKSIFGITTAPIILYSVVEQCISYLSSFVLYRYNRFIDIVEMNSHII